jgi:hypothetical protein
MEEFILQTLRSLLGKRAEVWQSNLPGYASRKFKRLLVRSAIRRINDREYETCPEVGLDFGGKRQFYSPLKFVSIEEAHNGRLLVKTRDEWNNRRAEAEFVPDKKKGVGK